MVERWHSLFKGNLLSQRFARGEVLDVAEREVLQEVVVEWRHRLCDISCPYFITGRLINEGIARQANAEDGCTGPVFSSAIHGIAPSGSLAAVQILS